METLMSNGVCKLLTSPITAIATALLVCIGPLAMAQTDAEASVRAKILALCGSITKNKEGKIEGILLNGCTDEEMESIDFTILKNLNAVEVFGMRISNRS